MKKVLILRYGLALTALLATVLALYACFWRLPAFQFGEGKGHCESPTGEYLLDYKVNYQVCEEEIREDTPSWFVCTLLSKPEYKNGVVHWSWENSKTIYCEKNATDFEAEWVDEDTVRINGRLLQVPGDTYDYRRDWRNWLN